MEWLLCPHELRCAAVEAGFPSIKALTRYCELHHTVATRVRKGQPIKQESAERYAIALRRSLEDLRGFLPQAENNDRVLKLVLQFTERVLNGEITPDNPEHARKGCIRSEPTDIEEWFVHHAGMPEGKSLRESPQLAQRAINTLRAIGLVVRTVDGVRLRRFYAQKFVDAIERYEGLLTNEIKALLKGRAKSCFDAKCKIAAFQMEKLYELHDEGRAVSPIETFAASANAIKWLADRNDIFAYSNHKHKLSMLALVVDASVLARGDDATMEAVWPVLCNCLGLLRILNANRSNRQIGYAAKQLALSLTFLAKTLVVERSAD